MPSSSVCRLGCMCCYVRFVAAAGKFFWRVQVFRASARVRGFSWALRPCSSIGIVTWREIFRFMGNIGSDHAPPEWIDAGAVERFRLSFTSNLLPILDAIGWSVVALAVYGLVVAILQLRRSREEVEDSGADTPVCSAVFSFRIATGCLDDLFCRKGKPAAISRLIPRASRDSLRRFRCHAPGVWKATQMANACKVLLVLMLMEGGLKAQREVFFWSRDDTALFGKYGRTVMRDDARGAKGAIKTADPEGLNMAVFRNLRSETIVPAGKLWARINVAPVPAIPMPWSSDWIFMNGPCFPRSDRMFRLMAGRPISKTLVFEETPGPVRLGIRSGSWPASVTVSVAGQRFHIQLGPNQESIYEVPTRGLRLRPRGAHHASLSFLPLDVRSEVGDAWVTVLHGDAQHDAYRLFGCTPNASPPELSATPWDLKTALAKTRYLENEAPLSTMLSADGPSPPACSVVARRCRVRQDA